MLTLIGLIVLASVLPVKGDLASWAAYITNAAIGLLFSLAWLKAVDQGGVARSCALAVTPGLVLSVTFLLFPLLAWALRVLQPLLGEQLYQGDVFERFAIDGAVGDCIDILGAR